MEKIRVCRLVWPLSACWVAPVAVSQSRTVLSHEADAGCLPSGENATAVTLKALVLLVPGQAVPNDYFTSRIRAPTVFAMNFSNFPSQICIPHQTYPCRSGGAGIRSQSQKLGISNSRAAPQPIGHLHNIIIYTQL
jgi:hypothetical protein